MNDEPCCWSEVMIDRWTKSEPPDAELQPKDLLEMRARRLNDLLEAIGLPIFCSILSGNPRGAWSTPVSKQLPLKIAQHRKYNDEDDDQACSKTRVIQSDRDVGATLRKLSPRCHALPSADDASDGPTPFLLFIRRKKGIILAWLAFLSDWILGCPGYNSTRWGGRPQSSVVANIPNQAPRLFCRPLI